MRNFHFLCSELSFPFSSKGTSESQGSVCWRVWANCKSNASQCFSPVTLPVGQTEPSGELELEGVLRDQVADLCRPSKVREKMSQMGSHLPKAGPQSSQCHRPIDCGPLCNAVSGPITSLSWLIPPCARLELKGHFAQWFSSAYE